MSAVTQQDLHAALKNCGFPVVYNAWKPGQSPALPWVAYRFTQSHDLMADGLNYAKVGEYDVELYAEKKDLAAEGKVEAALRGLGLAFEKYEQTIDEEGVIEVVYTLRLIGESYE